MNGEMMDGLRILVLVPTAIEQLFFLLPSDRFDLQIIGTGKDCVNHIEINERYERAILFGCCGIMQHSHKKDVLFIPEQTFNFGTGERFDLARIHFNDEWRSGLKEDRLRVWLVTRSVTTDFSVNSELLRNGLLDEDYYDIVDQEDAWCAEFFREKKIPFSVVRYGVDYCGRPLKPYPVYRKLFRWFQHFRMQREFHRLLMSGIK